MGRTTTAIPLLLAAAAALAGFHPHFSPAAMRQRIREIDALLALEPPKGAGKRALLLEEQAQLLDGTDRLGQALVLFDRAIRLNPKDPKLYYNQASILITRGLPARAVPWLERAVPLAPGDPNYPLLLAQALEKCGRLREAATILLGIAGADKDKYGRAEKFTAAALLLEKLGRIKPALQAYDAAIKALPGDARQLSLRGRFRIRTGAFAAGAADLAAAVAAGPEEGDAFAWQVERGAALARGGRKEASLAAYRRAVATITELLNQDPSFPEDLLYHRALAHHALGAAKAAAKDLREALKILPGEPPYLALGMKVFPAAGQPTLTASCAKEIAAEKKRRERIRREDAGFATERKARLARQERIAGAYRQAWDALETGGDPAEPLKALTACGAEGRLLAARLGARRQLSQGRAAAALATLDGLPATVRREEAWAADLRLRALRALGREAEGRAAAKLLQTYLLEAKK